MRNKTGGMLAAIFKGLAPALKVIGAIGLLALLTGSWWPGPPGPNWYGLPVFIPGLVIGTALMVFVPYLKTALQAVAESGEWAAFTRFDARYLAFFLLPLIMSAVGFLVVPGLWEAAHSWGLVEACGIAYAGVDLAKDGGKIIGAATEIRQSQRGY